MAEITVRVLDGSDWPLYRDVRLRALEESPASFSAQLADEVDQDEPFWRGRMDRSHLLLAERDGRPQGIVSLGPYAADSRRVRSSGCMSSLRHAVRACPGDSSRQPPP
jgi:hypothetical protein